MITGDFNHMKDTQLKNFPLSQIVTQPTHGVSVLDCMYTNIKHFYNTPSVGPGLGLSDHGVVVCKPTVAPTAKPNKLTVTSRDNRAPAKASFVQALQEVDWTPLYAMDSCQQQVDLFYATLKDLLDHHMPLRTVSKETRDKPWITEEYKALIAKRQKAHKQGNKAMYRLYRNRVNRASKRLRATYYQNQVQDLKDTNPRMWWKKTKSLLGKDVSSASAFQGILGEQYSNDTSAMINGINTFLESVSSELEPLVPNTEPVVNAVPSEFIISRDTVERKLMSTKVNKAPGPDGIPNWVLHDLGGLISGPVCAIFNSSLRESIVPEIWRSANVTPLPKVTPPKDITSDIRPISLTPILAKHLESIIGGYIMTALDGKMDTCQFGGVKGLSTVHALVDMLHHWHTMVHDGDVVRILFLDYSKAFDLVDHTILIAKFTRLGVPSILTRWLSAFLLDRRQRVKLNEDVSDWLTLKGGMPQGSWLGPLCFIVFISDLQLNDILLHKYMDDTTLSEGIKDGELSKMQQSGDTVVQWSNLNKTKLNTKKTKEMVINFKKRPVSIPSLTLNNSVIDRVSTFKILGVLITDNLAWEANTNLLLSKSAPRLYYLRQLKRSGLLEADLLIYYKAIIRPVLEYACPVWHPGLTKLQSDLIEGIQRRALRIILPTLSYSEALDISRLETLVDRRDQICRKLFSEICQDTHKLNYLIPCAKTVPYSLRSVKLPVPVRKNKRYCSSFIVHSLVNYQ